MRELDAAETTSALVALMGGKANAAVLIGGTPVALTRTTMRFEAPELDLGDDDLVLFLGEADPDAGISSIHIPAGSLAAGASVDDRGVIELYLGEVDGASFGPSGKLTIRLSRAGAGA